MTGTETKAFVERCDSRSGAGRTGTVTTCHGSWVVDGVRHTGKIDGARRADEGKEVSVRANGSRTTNAKSPGFALQTTGILLAIGLVNHVWVIPRTFKGPTSEEESRDDPTASL
ncbi:hypothetical protein [Actinomadura pelletieri]|uniref:hypothetical protein n=1 Tax=Actinomadura pelletieri TaxID=111805 RepID=UPI0011C3FA7A|nr:hypothetical protein [Actinomadura pelletieri]